MLSLLTLDDAEHPFLRSIEQSPATFELNRRIAALFSALPPDVFNMRLRAAISLFLNAIAAERRVCSILQRAYVERKRVVQGKSVPVGVERGGRRILTKKN